MEPDVPAIHSEGESVGGVIGRAVCKPEGQVFDQHRFPLGHPVAISWNK
jgi:hypothetical protein